MNKEIKIKYAAYPVAVRKKLLALRTFILDVAAKTKDVGAIEESLKWNELSFNTAETKTGSPFRMDWKEKDPHRYHLYFSCNTSLISIFKTIFPDEFEYGGNRSISFQLGQRIPKKELAKCIQIALTYKAGDYKNYYKKNNQAKVY